MVFARLYPLSKQIPHRIPYQITIEDVITRTGAKADANAATVYYVRLQYDHDCHTHDTSTVTPYPDRDLFVHPLRTLHWDEVTDTFKATLTIECRGSGYGKCLQGKIAAWLVDVDGNEIANSRTVDTFPCRSYQLEDVEPPTAAPAPDPATDPVRRAFQEGLELGLKYGLRIARDVVRGRLRGKRRRK